MKILISAVVVIAVAIPATSSAFFMDFEEGFGFNATQIVGIPGVTFTNSADLPWVYGDSNTNLYNTYSVDLAQGWGAQNYNHYGYVWAWLGTSGNWGRIDFDDQNGTWFEVGVTAASNFWIEAYDSGDNLLDTMSLADIGMGSGNLRGWGFLDQARLRVDAPSGQNISYVLVHDGGNFWEVDQLRGDMEGGPVIPEPSTLLLMGGALVGMAGFARRKLLKR